MIQTSIIYFLDNICRIIDEMFKQIKELTKVKQNLLEIEMIKADIEYVRQENQNLKKLQFPKKLIEDEQKNYICPFCQNIISKECPFHGKLDSKFCPECGQRIYYSKNCYIKKKHDGAVV